MGKLWSRNKNVKIRCNHKKSIPGNIKTSRSSDNKTHLSLRFSDENKKEQKERIAAYERSRRKRIEEFLKRKSYEGVFVSRKCYHSQWLSLMKI